MIKRILVLLTGEPTDEATLLNAYMIARTTSAHITMTLIRTIAGPIFAEGHEGIPESLRDELASIHERGEKQKEGDVLATYDGFIKRNGIIERDTPTESGGSDDVTANLQVIDGYAPDVIARIGGAYDLIVLGRQSGSDTATSNLTRLMIEASLFTTGRPVLISPTTISPKLGEKILIAWNRSAQAARAFHAAKALFLDRAERIRLLSVTTGAKAGPEASEIAENLAWHGIDAEVREFSPDHRSIGDVLLAQAGAMGADLVVMGAFSHSRLRNLFLGGVTAHVLDNTEIPVLMAH